MATSPNSPSTPNGHVMIAVLRRTAPYARIVFWGAIAFTVGATSLAFNAPPWWAVLGAVALFLWLDTDGPGVQVMDLFARGLHRAGEALSGRKFPRDGGAARDMYFALDKRGGKIMRRLDRTDNPATRALLLDDLAGAEQAMADIHMEAFGPDPIDWEDGRDLSESHALSARLTRFVAGCEHELAGTPSLSEFHEDFAGGVDCDAVLVMSKLAHERDRSVRADLIDEFYEIVVEPYGGHAAEILACLAASERSVAGKVAS